MGLEPTSCCLGNNLPSNWATGLYFGEAEENRTLIKNGTAGGLEPSDDTIKSRVPYHLATAAYHNVFSYDN